LSRDESHLPDLVSHLHSITREQSYRTRIEACFRRLQILRNQARRFFLDRIERIEADSAVAREEWSDFVRVVSRSIDEGQQALDAIRVRATEALHQRRIAFDERLAELESRAAKNLTSVFESWQAINWRTLRSAVQRNGVWFSSSLHREFDLN